MKLSVILGEFRLFSVSKELGFLANWAFHVYDCFSASVCGVCGGDSSLFADGGSWTFLSSSIVDFRTNVVIPCHVPRGHLHHLLSRE